MEQSKFNVKDAIEYLKYTSLLIESFLRDYKLPLSMKEEVETEVKKTLSQCDGCGVWQSKSSIIDGECAECNEEDKD